MVSKLIEGGRVITVARVFLFGDKLEEYGYCVDNADSLIIANVTDFHKHYHIDKWDWYAIVRDMSYCNEKLFKLQNRLGDLYNISFFRRVNYRRFM